MPSDYNTAFQETMTLLKAGFDTEYPDINIEWPNVQNQKPEERDGQKDITLPWVRVVWQHVDSQQRGVGSVLGSRRFETRGLLTVSFFAPSGYGTAVTAAFLTYVLTLFTGISTTSGVIYHPGQPREVGQDTLWFRSDALIDFQYDEIR